MSSCSVLLSILISLFLGCATVKEEPSPPEVPNLEEPSPPEVPNLEEPSPPKPPVLEETPEEKPQEKETETFVVSKEVFKQAFEDIEILISELNNIIRSKNFRLWRTYLTQEYIDTFSNPKKLLDISKQPVLKKRGIKLNSLQDYFFHVVVPSRSRVKLDDLSFIDDSRVKAITFIDEKRSILYLLEKINDTWKIGI